MKGSFKRVQKKPRQGHPRPRTTELIWDSSEWDEDRKGNGMSFLFSPEILKIKQAARQRKIRGNMCQSAVARIVMFMLPCGESRG